MNEIQVYEKKANSRKHIYIGLFASMAILLPLTFYVFTIYETLALKNLDQERYDFRMKDSLIYSLLLFGFLVVLVSPFIFLMNNLFKRYLEFIKTLSAADIKKLLSLNERENSFYKYMPSYIIKENTVTFFSMFRENTINFNDIIRIDVKENFYKRYKASITIKTTNNKFFYTLVGDSFKTRYLVNEALNTNKTIENNENWNC